MIDTWVSDLNSYLVVGDTMSWLRERCRRSGFQTEWAGKGECHVEHLALEVTARHSREFSKQFWDLGESTG